MWLMAAFTENTSYDATVLILPLAIFSVLTTRQEYHQQCYVTHNNIVRKAFQKQGLRFYYLLERAEF